MEPSDWPRLGVQLTIASKPDFSSAPINAPHSKTRSRRFGFRQRAARCPSFPTDDPVIKRIYAVGMDSSRLVTEAHVLFDSLGPRLMGTPNINGPRTGSCPTYKSLGRRRQGRTVRHLARLGPRPLAHRSRLAADAHASRAQMVGYSPGTADEERRRSRRSSCRASRTAPSS